MSCEYCIPGIDNCHHKQEEYKTIYDPAPYKEKVVQDPQPQADPVEHPTHYTSHPSGVECSTITRHMSFNIGNVFKYLWRCDHKDNRLQDLRKAKWYLEDEIKLEESKQAGGK